MLFPCTRAPSVFFQFNISYPATGCQKCIEIDDERRLLSVYDLRMAQELDGGKLGDEFAGYIFRITGGNDKQGREESFANNHLRQRFVAGHNCSSWEDRPASHASRAR